MFINTETLCTKQILIFFAPTQHQQQLFTLPGNKVWDIFLYGILHKSDPTGAAQQFYMACINNDEDTKGQYHQEYFAYTLDALKTHVYSIMNDAENLTMKAQTYDLSTHPRVPVIVAHNQLVSQTFAITAALLEQMG